MNNRRSHGRPLFLLLAFFLPSAAEAQNYRFSVVQADMQVYVQPNASIRIEYELTFQNAAGVHPIDVVDIGVPTERYDRQSVKAWCDDRPLRTIRESQYVKPGFEVHLEGATIPAGGKGKFRCQFTVPDMVYQDTTRPDYASLRITPTWFGEQYVQGTTLLNIVVHLLPGIEPDDVLHQGQNFSEKIKLKDHVTVVWRFPTTRFTQAHLVGLSFPKKGMERVVTVSKYQLLMKWFTGSIEARLSVGLIFFIFWGIAFFRFTGGTGLSVFLVLSTALVISFALGPLWQLLSVPVAFILMLLNERFLRRRRRGYMPPIAQVEGGGIKRGLTAPEAAVLLEMPLARVLGLVIFGLIRKGVLRAVQTEPLVVEVDEAFRTQDADRLEKIVEEGQTAYHRKTADGRDVVLHVYERPFVFLIENNPGKPIERLNFGMAMKRFIELTAKRMAGFDLSDTQDYYRAIVRRAVEQAKSVGDIQQRAERIDRDFDWIFMGPDPTIFGGPYRPRWFPRHDRWDTGRGGTPVGPSFPTGPGSPSAPYGGLPGETSFGDVAASFSGWAENLMGGLASSVSPSALNLPKPSGGFLDLSGVDRITGEILQSLAESAAKGGSGRGGGGGGCACACAGCACACACAGGGR